MGNIFSTKMARKDDLDLVNMVLSQTSYQPEAIEAALVELHNRGLLDSSVLTEETKTKLLEIRSEILHQKRNEAAQKSLLPGRSSYRANAEDRSNWIWLPLQAIRDQIGFYALLCIMFMVNAFPAFERSWMLWLSATMLGVLLWQVTILSTERTKRAYHFHTRAIFALVLTVSIFIRDYFLSVYKDLANFISIFVVLFALTGLASVILYYALPAKWLSSRFYFLHRLKVVTFVLVPLLIILFVFKEGIFISNLSLKWNDRRPLTIADFRGYPDLFSYYDAAIDTDINYAFDETGKLLYLDAVCHTENTWIDWEDRDAYFLLQHERYHFHIAEIVARMARKAVVDEMREGEINQDKILDIIKKHRMLLNQKQFKYDSATDHSLISDQQSIWQYHVDSMLMELDAYWTSDILQEQAQYDSIKFFRFLSVNGRGEYHPQHELMSGEHRYASHYRFRYDDLGRVKEVSYWFQGRRQMSDALKAATVKLNYENDSVFYQFYDQNDKPVLIGNSYHESVHRKVGNDLVMSYFDIEGNAARGKDGEFQACCLLDGLGRVREKRFCDRNKQPLKSKEGHAIERYDYKESALFASAEHYYDESTRPVVNNEGIHRREWERDEHGKITIYKRYDTEGNLLNLEGFMYKSFKYNDLGSLIEVQYLDEDFRLTENDNGFVKITWSDDRYGNVNRRSRYNINNVLKENEDGIATTYKKYDSINNLILWADYDSGDRLVFDGQGYGKATYQRDSLGRILKLTNYNGYDYPVSSKYSGSIEILSYDSSGLHVNGMFMTWDGKPDTAEEGNSGYYKMYDGRNNLVQYSLYDEEGNPKEQKDNVATFLYSYDEKGKKLEARFLDAKGNLAYGNQGIAINQYKYDSEGRRIERSYYDTLEQLALFDGVARIQWDYDKRGNVIEERYFGSNDLLLDSGKAIILKKYNAVNKCIEEKYLNHKRRLIGKIAIIRYSYDDDANERSKSYFDSLDQPTINSEGIHRYTYEYKNRVYTGKSYYNTNYRLTPGQGGYTSVHLIKDTYDNLLEQHYLDEHKSLINDSLGIAITKFEYDSYDRIIKEYFYDNNNQPTLRNGKYHYIDYKRNRSGDIIEKSYRNLQGGLVENEDGVAMYRFFYNRNGAQENEETFDLLEAESLLG